MIKKIAFKLTLILILGLSQRVSAQVKNMNLNEFIAKIKTSNGAQLVDVRTPGEWAQGKIASSHLISIADPNFLSQASKLDKNKPVFVYCAVGGRSPRAAYMLSQAGFKQVYNLSGTGYRELAAKGIK
jgi:rhodanese-related sulfurtransferase